jgi:hypothetical protein
LISLRRIVQRIRDFLIPQVFCEVLIFQSTAKTGPFGYPWWLLLGHNYEGCRYLTRMGGNSFEDCWKGSDQYALRKWLWTSH